MQKILYLYKMLEDITLNSSIVKKEHQSIFFKKVLALWEPELEKVVLELLKNIKSNNIVKRKYYLKWLNEENRFISNMSHNQKNIQL